MNALPSTNLFSLLPPAQGAGGEALALSGTGLTGEGQARPDGFVSLLSAAMAGKQGLLSQPEVMAAGQPILLGRLNGATDAASGAGQDGAGATFGTLQELLQNRSESEPLNLSALMQGGEGAEYAFDRLLSDAGIQMSGAQLRETLGQLGIDDRMLSEGLENSDQPDRLAALVIGLSAGLSGVLGGQDDSALSPGSRDSALDPNAIQGHPEGDDEAQGAAHGDQEKPEPDLPAVEEPDRQMTEAQLDRSERAALANHGPDPDTTAAQPDDDAKAAQIAGSPGAGPETAAHEAEAVADRGVVPAMSEAEAVKPAASVQSAAKAPDAVAPPKPSAAGQPTPGAVERAADGTTSAETAPDAADTAEEGGNPLLAQRQANERAAALREEPGFSFAERDKAPSFTQQTAAMPHGTQTSSDLNGPKTAETIAAIRAAAAGQGGDSGGGVGADLSGGDGQSGQQPGQEKAEPNAAGRSDLLNRTNFAQQVALARGHSPQQANITGQVALHIQRMAATRTDVLTLQLEPADMGRLDISLEIQDGRVQARVAVENPQTYDMLRQDARALERALQNAGLDTDGGSLNFSLKDQGQQDQGQGHDARNGTQHARDRGPLAGDADPLAAGAVIEARALLGDGRLNLTI